MKTIRNGLLLLGLLAGTQLAAAPSIRIKNPTTKMYQVKLYCQGQVDGSTWLARAIYAGQNLQFGAGQNCFDTIEIYNGWSQLIHTIRLADVQLVNASGQPQTVGEIIAGMSITGHFDDESLCITMLDDAGNYRITGAIKIRADGGGEPLINPAAPDWSCSWSNVDSYVAQPF